VGKTCEFAGAADGAGRVLVRLDPERGDMQWSG